jgi:uncharacterized membrane protein
MLHIRNPAEWGVDQARLVGRTIESMSQAQILASDEQRAHRPAVRRIAVADLVEALQRGMADFGAFRTDVVFLGAIYPIIGLVLARLVFGYALLPFLFPLASGFALVGPVAAVGLNEMSRQREAGAEVGWGAALGVFRAPSFGAIVALGVLLMLIFLLWLGAAAVIYDATLGPEPPASTGAFLRDVLATDAGWSLIVAGCGVGFLFALLVLAISVVSFPLLLDRKAGLDMAIGTSLRAVAANPAMMALWGAIVAAALVVGSLPLFLGLIVVMPVLGHATWHLYRKVVVPADASDRVGVR